MLRRLFPWKFSGVFIPLFWGSGLAMLAVALALESLRIVIWAAILLSYVFFVAALIWSIGYWLQSDALKKKNPLKWNRNRRRNAAVCDKRVFLLWKWGGCAAIAILFGLSLWATYHTTYVLDLTRLSGLLIPSDESSPFKFCQPEGDEVALYLGGVALKTSSFPIVVLSLDTKPMLSLDRNRDGSISLSGDILDKDGKVVATIDNNVFLINQNNYLRMRRTDFSDLIVEDQYRTRVLNVKFYNPAALRLTGQFHSGTGVTLNISGAPRSCTFTIEKGVKFTSGVFDFSKQAGGTPLTR
jgi:hypothetical protein